MVYRHGTILIIVRAVVVTLGNDDIEDGVPDREQVDSEREKIEVKEKEKGDKTRMERLRTSETLSHDVSVITRARCMRKITCEVYLDFTSRRLQWIAIDCKRNQL